MSYYPKEKFKILNKISKFYESFYSLNFIISGGFLRKNQKKSVEPDQRVTTFDEDNEQLMKNSFFLRKLRCFMLFNIISYFFISVGYQIYYYTSNMNQQNRNLFDQTKFYFIYAITAFVFELGAVYEISRIVNNKDIVDFLILFILFDIFGSQLKP